jgi:hypothetical protein
MAPGALPRPGRVLEQRLPTPEIFRWRRQSYGIVLEISPTLIEFSVPRLLIGEGASSGVAPGLLTPRQRGQGLGHAGLV